MRHTVRLILVVVLTGVPAAAGRAQLGSFYPIGEGGLSLNNADFSKLVDAANDLLRQPRLAKGAITKWQNDQTGSSGTISVTKTFIRDSMLCHTLSYETIPMATPPANRTVLNWCKTNDGSWKILA
jgi:surface antigen